MKHTASSVEEYISHLPDDKRIAVERLRNTIVQYLPAGFEETMSYGMIGYVVPHTIYPPGYHCDPKLPLPFINVAAQKNFVALYHMGLYANEKLMQWFVTEFPKHTKAKLDMGKSCIRFKKPDDIPYKLIAELCSRVTVDDWITNYETQYKSATRSKQKTAKSR